jgi:ABC-type sulfate transport system substrate-binding protein
MCALTRELYQEFNTAFIKHWQSPQGWQILCFTTAAYAFDVADYASRSLRFGSWPIG